MTESGHDKSTPLDYVRFACRLGISGMVALARRFVSALAAMIAIWHDHFSDAAEWVRQEHERKLGLLAEAKKISVERLTALLKLQRPPVTRSLALILASLMLDRLVIVAIALVAVLTVGLAIDHGPSALLAAAGTATLALVLGRLWTKRRECPDASAELRERAPLVAKLFPAAFVVMGHTHMPEVHAVPAAETTYVNLGAWAEGDAEEGFAPSLPATRTHLVLSYVNGAPVAELYRWKASGPEQFSKGSPAPRTS
jgi:hypothetical protein